MATVNLVTTGSIGLPGRRGVAPVSVIETEVDFADVLASKGAALEASDVVQAIAVPAGTIVMGVGLEVVTAADSTTLTLDVGDGTDADGYVDGADGKTVGMNYRVHTLNAGATVGLTAGKAYTASDTIDITMATLTGTLTTGVVRVFAIVADLDHGTTSAGTARDATDA